MAKAALRKPEPLLGPEHELEAQELHEHLYQQCPWYKAVSDGEGATEPHKHCDAEVQASVALTPRTPEASTVVKPTVPPGGPGLFHHKGLHLPPYIEHLWFHLVKRYGKHKAYGVAVGVVKKWAKGINPGGWKTKSGKGKRTHPDVRAAAARNVAEWERDRAIGHTKATNTDVAEVLRLAKGSEPDSYDFPGDELHAVTPVPASTKEIYTAHRADEMSSQLAHACERMTAARKAPDAVTRDYHMKHIANHLVKVLENGHQAAGNFRDNYPREGGELDAMSKVMGMSKALSPDAKIATTAHLLQSVMYDATHAKRHADTMLAKPGTPALWSFNADHCEKHLKSAFNHAQKLAGHLKDNYPAESRWLKTLEKEEGHSDVRLAASAAYPKGLKTAPGAKPYFAHPFGYPATKISAQLKHVPSQTVAPSPPLPPGSTLPTQAECDALAAAWEKDNPDKNPTLTGAIKQLRDAGHKFSKNEAVHALQSLRGAQMGLLATHFELRRNSIPAANVFTAANVPPAAASSAHASMAQSAADREKFRKHYVAISALIDRTRRHYFHGMYGGYAMARFSREDLEKMLIALADEVT